MYKRQRPDRLYLSGCRSCGLKMNIPNRSVPSWRKMCIRDRNTQCGFIKFGSRVDVYLPLGTEVLVKLGDKVTGSQTPIARLK